MKSHLFSDLKWNPETKLAIGADAVVVRQLPVMVQQLSAADLRLAVDQELVDRLEHAVPLSLAEILNNKIVFKQFSENQYKLFWVSAAF